MSEYKPSKTWYQGTVTQTCEEPRSYIITTAGGSKVRRNRRHLRETIETTGNIPDGALRDNMLPRSDTATSTAGRRDDSSAENEEGEEGVLCEESKSQEETRTTRPGRVVKMPVRYQELDHLPARGQNNPFRLLRRGRLPVSSV